MDIFHSENNGKIPFSWYEWIYTKLEKIEKLQSVLGLISM